MFRVGTNLRSDLISQCMSCNAEVTQPGLEGNCLYNAAYFNPDATFYIHECLGPGVPTVEVRNLQGSWLQSTQNYQSSLGKQSSYPCGFFLRSREKKRTNLPIIKYWHQVEPHFLLISYFFWSSGLSDLAIHLHSLFFFG